MGPPATPAIVDAALKAIAKPLPAGPFAPTWESLQRNYRTPSWFEDARFGIFIHALGRFFRRRPPQLVVRKTYVWRRRPVARGQLRTAKRDPDAWALLFKKSGARMVTEMGEHHDNFAFWDSGVTPFNAKKMGPHRDLVGDLAVAVRRQGMKVAISNHSVENFTFIAPTHELHDRLQAAGVDLFDPAWAAFCNVADRSDPAMARFLADWVNRNLELIDKYRPDMLWFDNGANLRVLDPLKLYIAAYYYNRARPWGKEVSLGTKFNAFAPSNDDSKQIGSILDFEKVGPRSPAAIGEQAVIGSLALGKGKVTGVSLLRQEGALDFTQDERGLKIKTPRRTPGRPRMGVPNKWSSDQMTMLESTYGNPCDQRHRV